MRAGLAEFAARGYEGATMRGIGKRADVDFTLITYHYKTKEILWRAVVDYYIGTAPFLEDPKEQGESGLSAADQLKQEFKDYLYFSIKFPDFDRFMNQAKMDTSDRLEWMSRRVLMPMRDHFVPLIEQAQSDGDVRSGNPDLIYYLLISMTSNWETMKSERRKVFKTKAAREGLIEEYWDMIADSIFK